ncbi:hypothetical protein MP228_003536 [Amoeboaphelidium protococcarum]|nr:hypothetical protein MP228_003536 [Amoeboaphelidium protococcarum]
MSTSLRRRKTSNSGKGKHSPKQANGDYNSGQSVPIHSRMAHSQVAPSPLSADYPLDFTGFQNLALILLVASNLRLVIENYLKYGFIVSGSSSLSSYLQIFSASDVSYCSFILAVIFGSAYLTLFIEQTAARFQSSYTGQQSRAASWGWWWMTLHVLNLSAMFCASLTLTYLHIDSPLVGNVPCTFAMVTLLKCLSFVLVNSELRTLACRGDDETSVQSEYDVQYPDNLTLGNVLYFACAPTLCYQPSYPRSATIRWWFVLKRFVECCVYLTIMWVLFEQYSRPILENAIRLKTSTILHKLGSGSELGAQSGIRTVLTMLERILKLSVPSIIIWLLMFYVIFHSYLNLWAELLRFGDRQFYRPWWNATTIAEYWRLWNIPVYNWVKRHIDQPMKARGFSRWASYLIAFFISAAAHEILVGVPLKVGVDALLGYNKEQKGAMWAFWGMFMQVPLIWLTEVVKQIEVEGVWQYFGYSEPSSQNSQVSPVGGSARGSIDSNMDQLKVNGEMNTADMGMRKQKTYLGNIIFWLSFCVVGQPLIVLLYYRAWYMREHPELLQQQ